MPKITILPRTVDDVALQLAPVEVNRPPAVREPAVPYPLLAQMIADAKRNLPVTSGPPRGKTGDGKAPDDQPIFRFD